ncbi:11821_t:CDS:2 [Paraglomus brasilianum]|uniref:11821_t:CDS:1 n=1 Tax=Paraglomus brasilianum TaxID=144538 RepID=A0A9N8Z4Z2_9GLOM|nr:11821_t:CDS:2 [Paraglomus brasilianum]
MSDDWDNVTVIRKRTSVPKVAKTQSALNAARRSNAVVGTEKKTTGGTNRHTQQDHQRLAKVDRENDVAPPSKLSPSVGKLIQQARQAKGLTQKDLAMKISEKANVINDYEMGRTIPNDGVLRKLERALAVKLKTRGGK